MLTLTLLGVSCNRGSGRGAPPLAPTSGIVTRGDVELRYVIEGRGIPCLVVGSSVYYPRTFSANLRQHFHLVFADSRFFALTDHDSVDLNRLSLEVLVEDVEAVRTALGIERMAVMGHSMFGLVALEYAKTYPEHVTHVIMIGTLPRYGADVALVAQEYLQREASDERKAMMRHNLERAEAEANRDDLSASHVMMRGVVAIGPVAWYDAGYDATHLWSGVTFNGASLEFFLNARLHAYRIGDRIERVTMPVFLAMGKFDFTNPHFLWDQHRDGPADLSYHLFERSGHHPMLEEASRFDRLLTSWMERE